MKPSWAIFKGQWVRLIEVQGRTWKVRTKQGEQLLVDEKELSEMITAEDLAETKPPEEAR